MPKTIGLQQLHKKVYSLVSGLPEDFVASIGEIDDAWDAIIYGASGNGKSNFTVMLLKALIKAMNCKCEYVSYEEGHSKTVQDTWIKRHNMLEEVGNMVQITDHMTYEELDKKMGKKQSAKIWVIDSIPASGLTQQQWAKLKQKYVFGRKRKIMIAIAWSEGDKPQGSHARAIEYYAQIKLYVDKLIVFPKSRFGGNRPFVIWEEGAKAKWGKMFWQKAQLEKPKREKKPKESKELPAAEPKTTLHVLPKQTEEEKIQEQVEQLKSEVA
jgi:hypothetical protein